MGSKESFDKGYGDGRKSADRDKEGSWHEAIIDETIGNPHYNPDKDHPESYKSGFEQGKRDGSKG